MLKNYFKIAFRNFIRNPVFSLINILSLTIGIVCCLLIILYISHELSYDRFHEGGKSIYRVAMEMHSSDGSVKTGNTTAAVGPSMLEEIPEVEKMTRFRYPVTGYYQYDGKSFFDQSISYADSTLFGMFTFELTSGNPETCLCEPYSVVLTEETALRIFGEQEPIGEQLVLNGENYIVTGLVKTPPVKSHIRFTSIISFSTLYKDSRFHMDWNGGWQYFTYIKLFDASEIETLEARMPDFMYRHINRIYEEAGSSLQPIFQPLFTIHMDPEINSGFGPGGSISNILIFSAIALFIIMIASINFMNLSTARASTRAKEVGIRKVVGADRKKIILQFFSESILMSLFGLILAMILIEIILPQFNIMIGRELKLYSVSNWKLILGIPFLVLIIGFLAGSYPSFYISAFQPGKIIKGVTTGPTGSHGIRNFLVVLQFIISIVLIISTLVIYYQIRYMKDKDVGYARENILVIPLVEEGTRNKYQLIKTEMSALPEVLSISASSDYPGHSITSNGYLPEGFNDDEWIMINVYDVDYDFIETYELEIQAGRGFSEAFPSDQDDYLINEKLADLCGWDEPVGKMIFRGTDHKVIGVVKDFNFASLHDEIKPLIFTMRPYMGFRYLSIRINSDD
ncbi:MAG: ABC transporter permease, partial [Bacteroidales bacterium]